MSPSPPFPSPLLPSHSASSAPHPGIIGEHRGASAIGQHQPLLQQQGKHGVAGGEPPNGEYLLHLLQAGSQQINGGNGGGGGGGYEQQQQQQQHSHYSFAMPGIVPGGGDIPTAAWDPAVAAMGPSHSYSRNGRVGGGGAGGGAGEGREFGLGLYPAAQYHNVSMGGSGWATHQHIQGFASPPSAASSSPSASISSSLSSSVDPRLIQGRTLVHPFVPVPGSVPISLYGGHVEMLQRRSAEWHPSPPLLHQQQHQLQGMLTESDISSNASNLSAGRSSLPAERGPHQQFFGDGAELMKLLQISTSKGSACADPNVSSVPGGSNSAMQKMSPAIVHGPIGPPKRSEHTGSSPADDLLGRFWPAPAVSVSNGLQDMGSKPPGFPFKENQANLGPHAASKERGRWGELCAEKSFDVLGGSKSLALPPFGNREGAPPRFGVASRLYAVNMGGLPDNLEYHDGRGLLGGWGGGDFFEEVGIVGPQYRKSSGGRPREDLYVKAVEQTMNLNLSHHEPQHLDGPSKESELEFSRDSNGRVDGVRGGGIAGRRGPSSRLEAAGRRGGRSVIGQWVAVNERQREREGGGEMSGPNDGGAESGSEKGSNSTGNSCKEESISFPKDGSGSQKVRDDLKRRRGQQQEWRMKTPPSHAQIQVQAQCAVPKVSDFACSSDSPEFVNGNYRVSSPLKIRPLALQVDHPGLPSNVVHGSPCAAESAVESSKKIYRDRSGYHPNGKNEVNDDGLGKEEEEELAEDLIDEREMGHRQGSGLAPAQEEVEYDTRQEHMREFRRHPHRTLATQSVKPEMRYRPDLEKFTAQMLAMYLSLIPTVEEERKRRQFLSHLDQLVARDWPGAALFLFGSCANAFGVCNSDIDVCLSINDDQLSKADLVLKMAAILRSDSMQDVQALTHARVPIVKFTDATTGISCDICVNNMLAVVNSKLLHDYSQIDVRLRQLAFLVKHWAKRRQVNETYRGTLSSYAYVLMCIHFLQQRKPAVLPCLQEMGPTYRVNVGSIDCAYYDQVETLQNFGIGNKETLGELLTSFFEYWAFRHDYNRAVISVRTGGYLSKDEKEWTRRIGNERHLICIEDPLEIVHDLGRVVDRHSIRVLRDEFHRAAKILRHDLNPCTTLFEPFIREKP